MQVYLEVKRTVVAFACLLLTASIMAAIQLYNDNVSIRLNLHKLPSLHDASRSLHGQWWVKPWMADSSLYVMVGGAVCGVVVGVVVQQGRLCGGIQIVRRFLWLMAGGYALRAVCLWGTLLPPSNPHCAYIERDWWGIVRAVPQLLGGTTHTCSDKIFSGHTLVATLLAAFWFKQCSRVLLRVLVAGNWVLMVSCSLAGKHHYTVDIVVGCFIAALLFHLYHMVLVLVTEKEDVADLHVPGIVKRAVYYMDGVDIRETVVLPTSTASKLGE